MIVIQCKDGKLEIGDWVLSSILCRDFLVYSKRWIANHTIDEVAKELQELALK